MAAGYKQLYGYLVKEIKKALKLLEEGEWNAPQAQALLQHALRVADEMFVVTDDD